MPTSMQRLDPGHYTINIGGTVYTVNKEDKRVPTGRSKRGTVKQVWVARRGEYVLEESTRYRDAKNAVFTDSELAPEDRPQASLDAPETDDDGTVQPSLFDGGDETVEVDDPQPVDVNGQAIPTPDEQSITESPAFVQHVQEEPVIPVQEHNQAEAEQTSFSWA